MAKKRVGFRWDGSAVMIGGLVLPIVVLAGVVGCERLPQSDTEQSPVLVRVNGVELTKHQFGVYLPEDYQDVLTQEEKREYIDRWVVTQLLYEEALKTGAGNEADIEMQLEQHKKDLIADRLIQSVIEERAVVTEDEVRAYYDEHREEYQKEYRVSHILVNTPEDAEKVKSLLGSKSFTYLQGRYSIDKHSRGGGDLGYLSKGNMVPEFEEVVFDMDTGDVSDVIESEFGYHIIKITDIRDARVKLEFADVNEAIANILTLKKREAVYDSLVTMLKSRAQIEYMDEAIGLEALSEPDTLPDNP